MNPDRCFSSETQLPTRQYKNDVFWQNVYEDDFTGKHGCNIAFCSAINPESEKAIVICNGRTESYLKYQELIEDLYHQGFSVYVLDHRGQGLSGRLTINPQKGHVAKFDDYVDDFSKFIDTQVKPNNHQSLYLLGHSMGGCIGTLYLQRQPETFNAAVFSSPMYGIDLPAPKRLIRWLADMLDTSPEREPNYVVGGGDYENIPFEDNELTQSEHRYQNYRKLYQDTPQIQLGAPTNHWLMEAIAASEQAIAAAKSSQVPILILQAEDDSIVDNQAQDCALGEHCQRLIISGARHEILIETDLRRNEALNAALDFFNQHQTVHKQNNK